MFGGGSKVVRGRIEGIGGWLTLLVVVVGVLTPLAQLGSVLALLKAAPRLEIYFGNVWPVYRAIILSIIGLRTVICLIVAKQLMHERAPKTPRLAIIGIWIAYVVLGAVSLTVTAVFSPTSVDLVEMAARLFWPLAICIVASAYLLKSKRVADTYSRES